MKHVSKFRKEEERWIYNTISNLDSKFYFLYLTCKSFDLVNFLFDGFSADNI